MGNSEIMDRQISVFQEGRGKNKAQPMLEKFPVNMFKGEKLGELLIVVRMFAEMQLVPELLLFCDRIEAGAMEYKGRAREQYTKIAIHEMEEDSRAKGVLDLFKGA
ncbi:MAG: hypothetical protein GY845_09600 [Planctomycetes bacterium]|nr:hypothetical protein [Planctomycetota bacterium]